jgi:hypothetical protein
MRAISVATCADIELNTPTSQGIGVPEGQRNVPRQALMRSPRALVSDRDLRRASTTRSPLPFSHQVGRILQVAVR